VVAHRLQGGAQQRSQPRPELPLVCAQTLDLATHLLASIDSALARLDEGTYGRCERCGRPISEERLEALPYATRCIECKRLEERG
jgi:DnaK suppressor protein